MYDALYHVCAFALQFFFRSERKAELLRRKTLLEQQEKQRAAKGPFFFDQTSHNAKKSVAANSLPKLKLISRDPNRLYNPEVRFANLLNKQRFRISLRSIGYTGEAQSSRGIKARDRTLPVLAISVLNRYQAEIYTSVFTLTINVALLGWLGCLKKKLGFQCSRYIVVFL